MKNEAKILHESQSPELPLAIVVEQDNNCTYAYLVLIKNNQFQDVICAAWIRNHKKAPQVLNFEPDDGSPLLSEEYCAHPDGEQPFDPATLGSLWSDDHTKVAITENNEIISVISIEDQDNLIPYAKDCTKANELVLPLNEILQ